MILIGNLRRRVYLYDVDISEKSDELSSQQLKAVERDAIPLTLTTNVPNPCA